MSSIYSKADNDVIISRINQLTPESKALWGKMTVDQMFKHCNEAIIVAFGENEIKVNFFLRLLGRLLKNKVFNNEFQKNSPTAKEFVFTAQYDFETAQKELSATSPGLPKDQKPLHSRYIRFGDQCQMKIGTN